MRKTQRPYSYVGFGWVENGHMVGVGWYKFADRFCRDGVAWWEDQTKEEKTPHLNAGDDR